MGNLISDLSKIKTSNQIILILGIVSLSLGILSLIPHYVPDYSDILIPWEITAFLIFLGILFITTVFGIWSRDERLDEFSEEIPPLNHDKYKEIERKFTIFENLIWEFVVFEDKNDHTIGILVEPNPLCPNIISNETCLHVLDFIITHKKEVFVQCNHCHFKREIPRKYPNIKTIQSKIKHQIRNESEREYIRKKLIEDKVIDK